MKSMIRIVSLALAIFLFVGSVPLSASAAGGTLKTGVAFINTGSLRLRSGPSNTSRTLDYGYGQEVVVILGRSGSWYRVLYDLREGYMHAAYLDVAGKENAELGYGRLNGSDVNVRSGPGTGYGSLGRAGMGERVYILGINDTWFKVIWGEKIGYIRSDFVDLTEIPYENRASAHRPLFFRGGKSTGVTPSAAALRGEQVTGAQIVKTARRYLGVPYLWGGTTPSGFDCSGFVQYVFRLHGVTLPRVSREQYKAGAAVSKAGLRPGDLVFFGTGGTVSHLGIYVGDGRFIHSSSSKGVTVSGLDSSYWAPRYMGARRVL